MNTFRIPRFHIPPSHRPRITRIKQISHYTTGSQGLLAVHWALEKDPVLPENSRSP